MQTTQVKSSWEQDRILHYFSEQDYTCTALKLGPDI